MPILAKASPIGGSPTSSPGYVSRPGGVRISTSVQRSCSSGSRRDTSPCTAVSTASERASSSAGLSRGHPKETNTSMSSGSQFNENPTCPMRSRCNAKLPPMVTHGVELVEGFTPAAAAATFGMACSSTRSR